MPAAGSEGPGGAASRAAGTAARPLCALCRQQLSCPKLSALAFLLNLHSVLGVHGPRRGGLRSDLGMGAPAGALQADTGEEQRRKAAAM